MTPGERQAAELTAIVDFLQAQEKAWEKSSETMRAVSKIPHPCPVWIVSAVMELPDGSSVPIAGTKTFSLN